ncbi:shikimate dehydrogenase [Streptomyces pathocidini]|uniref:Shikimate dehydrogenase n=1 Tax=Streptomyces pathocidini TaxID=1650571 RepID=A0ABW7URS2_9ACTN|nr:shikimate dehydrogenase [Streptomyces pathocidini]
MKQLAILGSPIGTALSPVLHRAAYTAMGSPWDSWSYRAIDCLPGQLGHFFDALDGTWAGLSLTMPLKRVAVPLLDEVSPLVRETGTANTVVLRDGRLIGENTDVHGMVQALREADVTGARSMTVLGAGATAATALAAARALDCGRVTAVVRAAERCGQLAQAARRLNIPLDVRPWSQAAEQLTADVVVSAVPPHAADTLAAAWTGSPGVLLDVVYRPWPTALATAAERAGRRVVGGLPMLVHQAAQQLRLQTGRPAPLEAMRQAALAVRGHAVEPPKPT